MANESILISEVIPASPDRIFAAWLDSEEHSAFTGSPATVIPAVGGEHRAHDGYIQGRTLELHEGSRIVQTWRTSEFPAESPDSRLEITLEPTLGGTLVTLLHTDIPAGQSDKYKQGWTDYYLSRMKVYFAGDAEELAGVASGGAGADLADDDQDDDELAPPPQAAPAKRPAARRPPAARVAAKAATPPATKVAAKAAAKPKAKAKAKVKTTKSKPVKRTAVKAKAKARPKAKATKTTARAAKTARKSKPVKKAAKKAAKKPAGKSASKSARGGAKAKGRSAARSRGR